MKKAQRIITSIIAFVLAISMIACSAPDKSEAMDGADRLPDANASFDNAGNAGNNAGNNTGASNVPTYSPYPDDGDGGGIPNFSQSDSPVVPEGSLEGDAMDEAEDAWIDPIPNEGADAGICENPFIKTEDMNISTFSADVDTASYTFLRKMINQGYSLDELRNITKANVIRTEELVNYFDYDYSAPEGGRVFSCKAGLSQTPWNDETYLMILGFKAREVEEKTANNLVFLIDTSGSMGSHDKLPLLKQSFTYLTEQLDGDDTVSIVTYAGSETVVLEGAKGNKTQLILDAINNLEAYGSTNGEAGIVKAYEIAETYFKPSGNNRIILASDGDLNVGIQNPEQLEDLVEEKRESGICLSVLGFGNGNYRDDNMSAIAQTGNGVYHYIDCAAEAERIFSENLLSTIHTVAKDVKFQLNFSKERVSEYRLIGYENRMLDNEDFNDDTKDAGDAGSGHTITVCYEIKLTDKAFPSGGDDGYSSFVTIDMRYKHPYSDVSELQQGSVDASALYAEKNDDFIFITAVIQFSMLLRDSQYAKNEITLSSIYDTLNSLELNKYQEEFKQLIFELMQREQ